MAIPWIVALPVANSLTVDPLSPAPAGGSGGSGVAPATPPPPAISTTSPAASPPPAAAPASAALSADAAPPRDPWEKTNRQIFAFDTSVDRHLLGPVSRGYSAALPFVLRHHISLVLANLNEPMTAGNALLQLRMGAFGKSVLRFTLNSTLGLAGIFDFASHHKLEHHTADFGQTLGRWGARPGPYVVMPLLGPANLRDGIGRVVDIVGDPISWLFGGITTTFGGSREGTDVVDGRTKAEPALRAVYDSTDPYATARSGYMQNRAAAVREATGKAEDLPDFDAS